MKSFYQKILDHETVKLDWFSDAVSSGLASVGVTKDVRDSLQPTVDRVTPGVANVAKSLLPSGGIVPASAGNYSQPQATGYAYSSNISPMMIAAGAGAVLLIILIVGRK